MPSKFRTPSNYGAELVCEEIAEMFHVPLGLLKRTGLVKTSIAGQQSMVITPWLLRWAVKKAISRLESRIPS